MRAVRAQVHALQLHCVYVNLNNQSKQAMGEPRARQAEPHAATMVLDTTRVHRTRERQA